LNGTAFFLSAVPAAYCPMREALPPAKQASGCSEETPWIAAFASQLTAAALQVSDAAQRRLMRL
jgi:hypothetical protein